MYRLVKCKANNFVNPTKFKKLLTAPEVPPYAPFCCLPPPSTK